MHREEIHLDITLDELDAWTNANCSESYDEPYLDWNWQPISDEQMLARVRRLQQETGEQVIFHRGERPGPGS